MVQLINEKLSWASEEALLSKKELEYLRVEDFNKCKENPPGRPIVSSIRGPLQKVGKYIDGLIKDLVKLLPSYVQDTGDVLNQIQDIVIPEGDFLVGMNVGMNEWGTPVVYHFLEHKFPHMGIQNEFILELLDLALKNNFFQFATKFFQQL